MICRLSSQAPTGEEHRRHRMKTGFSPAPLAGSRQVNSLRLIKPWLSDRLGREPHLR